MSLESTLSTAVGVGTALYGAVSQGVANKRLKRLMKHQTPYAGYDDMKNLLTQEQTGFDASAFSYLTNQPALSSSPNLANNISEIFGRNVDAILKTSAGYKKNGN